MTTTKGATFSVDGEASFGTAAGSPVHVRLEEIPDLTPTQGVELVANHVAGHQDPRKLEKPVAIDLGRENACVISDRVRMNPSGDSIFKKMMTSASWTCKTPSGATTVDDASATVSEFDLASDISGAEADLIGMAILVEQSTGLHVPVLVAGDSGIGDYTITPKVALGAAPANGATVSKMDCFTSTTSLSAPYEVGATSTLTTRLHTWGYLDDAYGDHSWLMNGCALAKLDPIEFGPVGTPIMLKYTLHAAAVAHNASDIVQETFNDSAPFAMITDDFIFSIYDETYDDAVVLTRRRIEKLTVDLGIVVKPHMGTGAGTIGGWSGYYLDPTNTATITITGFANNTGLAKEIIGNISDNTSQCIKIAQPTRSLNTPAFAIWGPNCHLPPGSDAVAMDFKGGDIIKFTAKFVCDVSGLNSDTSIAAVGSAPIYVAMSSQTSEP